MRLLSILKSVGGKTERGWKKVDRKNLEQNELPVKSAIARPHSRAAPMKLLTKLKSVGGKTEKPGKQAGQKRLPKSMPTVSSVIRRVIEHGGMKALMHDIKL